MGSTTPNYNLYKPATEPPETGWGEEVNANFDTIDTEMKNNKDTAEGHATRHQNGGADEVSVAGLSGELADPQPPKTHASSHENGGGDEVSVAGLSGELADPQPPKTHASDHQNGGGDEISVAGLSGELADAQTPKTHASTHEYGGSDAMAIDAPAATGSLRTVGTGALQACAGNDSRLSDARTPTAHATSHQNEGSDEISVAGLSGELADAQTPKTHASTHKGGGSDAIDAATTSLAGLMSSTDKTKLDGIEAGADVTADHDPKAHNTSHQSGGSDAIKLDDLATPDDNTDLNASTSTHGLLPKLDGASSLKFLRGDGTWAVPVKTVVKPSGTSRTYTTTFADDPDLTFGVGAGETWIFRFYAFFSTANAQPDIKARVTGPSTTLLSYHQRMYSDGGALVTGSFETAWSQTISFNSANPLTGCCLLFEGAFVTSDAGNVTLQWAQNTSSQYATTVLAGGYILAHRVG